MTRIQCLGEGDIDVYANGSGSVSISVRAPGLGQDWRMVDARVDVSRAGANELIQAIAPNGSVVVDRARFERLREFTDVADELLMLTTEVRRDAEWSERYASAFSRQWAAHNALQPGDLDSLP